MDENGRVNGQRVGKLLTRLAPAQAIDSDALAFDIDRVSDAITALRAEVPADAYTAPYLGTEREGNAVVIDDNGLILTIGYLLLESRRISVAGEGGRWVPAAYVGYDFETGFGLARAREPLGLPAIELGNSDDLGEGQSVVIAARGGRDQAIAGTVVSRREFAGYWEYLLDDAIYTAPAHPNWSGAALLGADGRLRGIGSLLVDDAGAGGRRLQGNLFVPIDLLAPIRDDLLAHGRPRRPARPWLGMFTADTPGGLVVVHVTPQGPADLCGIAVEDVVLRVAREPVAGLADMYRRIWSLGEAGVAISLTVARDSAGIDITVRSASRYDYFKTPRD